MEHASAMCFHIYTLSTIVLSLINKVQESHNITIVI